MSLLTKLMIGSVPVMAVLIAAAFLWPPELPLIWRQYILAIWGVGGILAAERMLFGPGWRRVLTAAGFVSPRGRAIVVALIVSLPMWLFLPAVSLFSGAPVGLNPGWQATLIGVILVNGIAEEVIHRAFIFGHLRGERSFASAAMVSAAVFSAQHLYLPFTIGLIPGIASALLAVLLAFPLAFLFEHSGGSAGAPAILHTSSNAPLMLFVTPETAQATILPHMGVVLVSMYFSFAFTRWLAVVK